MIFQSSDIFIAYKSTANGDCLFNSVSRLLVGNDSICHHLRLLTALELSMNSGFYAEHPRLKVLQDMTMLFAKQLCLRFACQG